ncbi:hypothetical protein HBN82_13300 [Pseudomonas lundensis]|uniref:hypothetical protein n=1 Tax=Pseudomonas lundensis TaxID=86185 RepID=UPI0014728912|nr:hypothetical protein [Pseudomonas lundensis]NNA16832.1 hypothetical protein [Pseudomonas lundensis]
MGVINESLTSPQRVAMHGALELLMGNHREPSPEWEKQATRVIYELGAALATAPDGEPEVRAWEVDMYGPYDTLEDAEAKSLLAGYPIYELIRLSDYHAKIATLQRNIADLKSAGEYLHGHTIDERSEFLIAWPEISKHGIDNGWRGVAIAAWNARAALSGGKDAQ